MKFFFTLICMSFVFYSSAQRCATVEYSKSYNSARIFTNPFSRPASGRDTLNNEVIIIPVVVHVLYNSDEQNISNRQVQSQIDALNKDYRRMNADAVNTPAPFSGVSADTRIVFCLSKVDPDGKATTGIIHKYTKETDFQTDDQMKFSSKEGDDAWDASKYLNLWVCNLSGSTLGYAVLPGSPAERDGVVIKYNAFGTTGVLKAPYNKGRTATHEIGHWLGLRHLWGDENCGDDGIADTPLQQTSNNHCPSFPHTSSCSINGYGDMFMNFMDFTDDACMNMFTQGQKSEMRGQFAKGNPKNSFLNSSVCESSNAEGGPVVNPVEDTAAAPLITTYPNPFNNEVTISSKNAADVVGKIVKLYDATGKLVVTQMIQSKKTTLYLNKLPSGIYLLRIGDGEKLFVYKLMKYSK